MCHYSVSPHMVRSGWVHDMTAGRHAAQALDCMAFPDNVHTFEVSSKKGNPWVPWHEVSLRVRMIIEGVLLTAPLSCRSV